MKKDGSVAIRWVNDLPPIDPRRKQTAQIDLEEVLEKEAIEAGEYVQMLLVDK